jgi:hypothetical protein
VIGAYLAGVLCGFLVAFLLSFAALPAVVKFAERALKSKDDNEQG